ncbi:MAG: FtsX-like permease family protein [Candidatus Aminicenantes bacterium]|nr:FtsX-like permease family protein [Candidatus Aminicenantes bacterium]
MINFIIKGVLRDRTRSLFPILVVAAGAMLTVFFYSYMQGGKSNFIDTSARYQTGHLKVTTRGYATEAELLPNDLALTEISSLLARLRADYPDIIWAPRIRFSGLLDVPDENGETRAQGPMTGLAVELIKSADNDTLTPGSANLYNYQKFQPGTEAVSRFSGPVETPANMEPLENAPLASLAGSSNPGAGQGKYIGPGLIPSEDPAGKAPKNNSEPPEIKEIKILNLEKALIAGRLPQQPREILVPSELARALNINPGDRVTIISSTMTGALAIADFTAAGIIRFGITPLDKGLVISDLSDIQQFLDMEDAAGEIFGFFPDFLYRPSSASRLAHEFNQKMAGADSEVRAGSPPSGAAVSDPELQPVMLTLGQQGGLADMIAVYDIYSFVLVAVFVAVMSIVLWNAGLMGSLRRYGEIGLRLAMGETRLHLYASLIGESLVIGLLGSALGTVIGLAISYYLQTYGINAEAFTKSSEMMMTNVIKAQVTWVSYVIGFIPGLLATVLGTAIAGLGVFRRRTATLMKEFEA